MEPIFTPAAPEDVETIFSLCREMILRYEDPLDIDLDRAVQWSRRKILTNLGQYSRILLDGQPTGYFRLFPREGVLELDDLYILPQFRRRGLGDAVLRHCIAQGQPLELYVFKDNHGALALYRKHGFSLLRNEGTTRFVLRREVL